MRRTIAAAIILSTVAPASAEDAAAIAPHLCIASHAAFNSTLKINASASASSIVAGAIEECRRAYTIPDPTPYLSGFYEGIVQGYRIRGENPPELTRER